MVNDSRNVELIGLLIGGSLAVILKFCSMTEIKKFNLGCMFMNIKYHILLWRMRFISV